MESNDDYVFNLIRKEIDEVNRSLPVFKKVSDFCIRKEPFEKNAQQKIRRFLYKSYESD